MENAMGSAQASTSGASVASDLNQQTTDNQTTEQEKTIKFEDHKRALDDMLKYKKTSQESDRKVAELQALIKDRDRAALEKGSDFKGLYELERGRADDLAKQVDSLTQKTAQQRELYARAEKLKAVQTALLNAGFKKEALKIIEKESLEELELELTTTGRVNILGVDSYVDRFTKDWAVLKGPVHGVQVNSGGGAATQDEKPLTDSYMVELSRSRKPEDQVKFKSLWAQYIQQKKK